MAGSADRIDGDPEETLVVDRVEELREIMGVPGARAASKDRTRLHPVDRAWIAASPFLSMATADADGRCDVSPKGDPSGFVHIVDDVTIAIPERPGNRRADGFHNVLANPHVGLIFLIPGRTDTLRINGRARIVKQAPYFEALEVKGHRPSLALEVTIEQLFYHCSKAFMRSRLWSTEDWPRDGLPTRAEIIHATEEPDETLAELEAHYGPGYEAQLYAMPKRGDA
jgi:hypothetical protein